MTRPIKRRCDGCGELLNIRELHLVKILNELWCDNCIIANDGIKIDKKFKRKLNNKGKDKKNGKKNNT